MLLSMNHFCTVDAKKALARCQCLSISETTAAMKFGENRVNVSVYQIFRVV